MPDAQDMDLVREFARQNSEAAFTELVRRHIALVHSVARRCTGNDSDAQDVTQAVFIILARKAAGLRERTLLPGWLYETTRFTAARLLRTNVRRQQREQEAYMQSTLNEADTADVWEKLSPHLEDAMSKLAERDRALLVLRFYQNKSGPEAAALLGIREGAAHLRVTRAIEKLRIFFAKRGVDSTAATIAETISTHSVQAAPVALAKSATAVAIAKGAAASTSTLTLIKGALKIMAWTKAKTVIVAGAGILLAAGTTTITVKEIHQHDEDSQWDIGQINSQILETGPHVVRVIPSKFPNQGGWTSIGDGRILGLGDSAPHILETAYGHANTRTILQTALPAGKFDFIANLPSGSSASLQQKAQKQFGVTARVATIETNVLFLRVKQTNAPGLKTATNLNSSTYSTSFGVYQLRNSRIDPIVNYAEMAFQIPVIDETGLTGHYDIDFKWDNQNNRQENLKQAIANELGLEFVPGTAPVEFLVVEKAK